MRLFMVNNKNDQHIKATEINIFRNDRMKLQLELLEK